MTFDAQRPVMAHGHSSAADASCRADWAMAEIRPGPPRIRTGHGRFVPWCPGLQERMAAVAGASMLRWGGSGAVNRTASPGPVSAGDSRFDPGVPHPARAYNFWLGGKDHFPADRKAAQEVMRARPPGRMSR